MSGDVIGFPRRHRRDELLALARDLLDAAAALAREGRGGLASRLRREAFACEAEAAPLCPGTAPVLPARLLPDGQRVAVRCPHCRRDHVHGSAGVLDGSNPHRAAHCTAPGSPYRRTGYVLSLAGERRA